MYITVLYNVMVNSINARNVIQPYLAVYKIGSYDLQLIKLIFIALINVYVYHNKVLECDGITI